MNKSEMIHNERKEYWRGLIAQCDASGQTQQDWCRENKICNCSMSKWRRTIWREEEAEKDFAAALEERAFVEMSAAIAVTQVEIAPTAQNNLPSSGKNCNKSAKPAKSAPDQGTTSLAQPDAVIGFRDYMVGVYEHTSSQVLQKVMEVLRHA